MVGSLPILRTTSMFGDLAEHGVAVAVGRRVVERAVVSRLMKNWAVAEFGSWVRAMAMVPASFLRPLLASFSMGARVAFSSASAGRVPPPWIMKPSMTRWKIRPS